MKISDWKTRVEKVISNEPIREVVKHYGEGYIDDLVEEDVEMVKKTGGTSLSISEDGITPTVQTKVVDRMRKEFQPWVTEKDDLYRKGEAEYKKSDLQEQISKINSDIDKQIEIEQLKYEKDNNYSELKKTFEEADEYYENKKVQHGGTPPVKGRIFLYLISILSVGFIEWFINYSTFNTKYPPGIAAGATVLIALSIALASHFHGGFLKQRVKLFDKKEQSTNKVQVILTQSFFSLLLIIALVIVTYNRYDVLVGSMVESVGVALAGVDSETESIRGVLIQFALLNILVWIVGVAISYFVHDPIPGYQESFKRMKAARKQFNKVDKKRQKELNRLEEQRKDEIENKEKEHLASQKKFDEIKNYLQQLKDRQERLKDEMDGSLLGIIDSHRKRLVAELKSFVDIDSFRVVGSRSNSLSLDEYAIAPIKLYLPSLGDE